MKKHLLVVGIVFLFVGMCFQPAFANESFISTDIVKEGDNSRDLKLGFILCSVRHIFWPERARRFTWNVNFECKDLDTGKIVENKTCLFGLHLFKYLTIGHDYEIKVTTSEGQETEKIEDLGLFHFESIDIVIFEYNNIDKVEDCDCQEIDSQTFVKVKLLMNKLKVVTSVLSKRFGNIPEIKEKCQELLDNINSNSQLYFPIICDFLQEIEYNISSIMDNINDYFEKLPDSFLKYFFWIPISLIVACFYFPVWMLEELLGCHPGPPHLSEMPNVIQQIVLGI